MLPAPAVYLLQRAVQILIQPLASLLRRAHRHFAERVDIAVAGHREAARVDSIADQLFAQVFGLVMVEDSKNEIVILGWIELRPVRSDTIDHFFSEHDGGMEKAPLLQQHLLNRLVGFGQTGGIQDGSVDIDVVVDASAYQADIRLARTES